MQPYARFAMANMVMPMLNGSFVGAPSMMINSVDVSKDMLYSPSIADSAETESVTDESYFTLTLSPLSVRVLGIEKDENDPSRLLYDIETCHQLSGDVYLAKHDFNDFKRLRGAILRECSGCHGCRSFLQKMTTAKLPKRPMIVMDAHKFGTAQIPLLTQFLRDLVHYVSQDARNCQWNGDDIDKSVGIFLGLPSLSEAEDVATLTNVRIKRQVKTHVERLAMRGTSMPSLSFCGPSPSEQSAMSEAKAVHARTRGYSDGDYRK